MGVRKPLDKIKENIIDVDALISKGAHVVNDNEKKEDINWKCINLRIPHEMIKQIDKILEKRIGISRTGWILEAIQQKLRNDEDEKKRD